MSDKELKLDNTNKYQFLKKWYNRIKNNLTMILLVPTFIGGLWQVFSLLGLGFEYLRFFSVKQLVADGLLMMILIPIYAALPFLVYFLIKGISSDLLKDNSKKLVLRKIVISIVAVVIIFYFNYYYIRYINSHFSKQPSTNIILLSGLLYIPLIEISVTLRNTVSDYFNTYLKGLKSKKNVNKLQQIWIFLVDRFYSTINLAHIFTILFAGASTIITFFIVINSMGDSYVSDNLVNLENVEKVVREKYGLLPEDFSIKYFNDSYIFLENETVSAEEVAKLKESRKTIPTEIIILEFKSLFKE